MKLHAFRLFLSSATVALFTSTPSLEARPHYGLGEFIFLTAGLNLPDWSMNNSSVLSYGSMVNMPALSSIGEIGALLGQLDQPYHANTTTFAREVDAFFSEHTGSRDGHHPVNRDAWETFASGQWQSSSPDSGNSRPIFDSRSWGGLIGIKRWVDDERFIGLTASYASTQTTIHNDGGQTDGENFRLRLYTALVPEGQPWWLVFGVSGGYVSYDTLRNMPLGNSTFPDEVTAKTNGYEIGLFAAFFTRLHISESLAFTPFARIDYDNVSINKLTEEGSDYNYALNRFNAYSCQTRIGAGLEYASEFSFGFIKANCTVAWASELANDNIKLTARFASLSGYTRHHVYANQLFHDAVEFTPSFSLVLKDSLVLQLSYQLQLTFDAQLSQTGTASIGWRF
ncbi:MAG: autotransporter outer membrane beta-barrel domain-containing protein [Puniceicoccales bacterium]|jgi:outer membrane autotransporter protein|nr:autotransporter outer membrane beta-barrel domain-containing protein [Puniceicoccales bacterium]